MKRLFAVLMMNFLVLLLVACASESEENVETAEEAAREDTGGDLLEEIKEGGKVVVGTEAAFQPFEYMEGGEIVGYGKDLLDIIVEDLGVELHQENIPWQGILPGLDTGRFDFIATAVSITPERAEKYAFTVPIADGTLALLTRKDDNSIQNPEDIVGKTVGSQLSSGQMVGLEKYNDELIEKYGEGVKEIKEYIEYPEAYQELATGRIDAVANSKANLSVVMQEYPDTFEMTETFGEPMWFSWVVRKGSENETLLEYINNKIIELRDDGTLAELQEKWFGFTMDIPDRDFLPTINDE